jgi:hypothetical protein
LKSDIAARLLQPLDHYMRLGNANRPEKPGFAIAATKKTSLLDYILLGENVLSPEHCRRLIRRFEASEALEVCHRHGGHSLHNWKSQRHGQMNMPCFCRSF